MLEKLGSRLCAVYGTALDRPLTSQYTPKPISRRAGNTVPITTATLLNTRMSFIPRKLASVMPQNTTSMTMTRYHLLLARLGSKM
jgi:hypothetical protein